MSDSSIFPVILAGGASSRLWPASNRQRPKWDLRLFKAPGAEHAQSLLEGAWDRARAVAPAANCFVVCGGEQAPLVRESLKEFPAENLLVEPMPRDTSGAVAYAAGAILKRLRAPDSISESQAKMFVLPGDHVISPVERFADCARVAARASETFGALVTFGIVAREASTAYGYVHRGETLDNNEPHVYRVTAFKEKPDLQTAKNYLASGEFYWNGGIFMWSLATLMREFEAQLPGHSALARSLSHTADSAEWDAKAREQFPELKRISIDFGIMEHAASVATVAADFNWDDIGSWSAVGPYLDEHAENAVGPETRLIAIDAEKNLVFAPGKRIALVDVEGLAVVVNGDDILICPLARDQDVKKVSEAAQAT